MAFVAGFNGHVKIQDSGGTLRDLSAFCNDLTFTLEAADLDTTTFGDTAKDRIGGLKDGSLTLSGNYDSTATTGPDAVLFGALGLVRTFEVGPEGSTSGKIKYSGSLLVQQLETSAGVDGLTTFSANFPLSGAVTRGTFA